MELKNLILEGTQNLTHHLNRTRKSLAELAVVEAEHLLKEARKGTYSFFTHANEGLRAVECWASQRVESHRERTDVQTETEQQVADMAAEGNVTSLDDSLRKARKLA